MSKLPAVKTSPDLDAQQRKLGRWLAEWRADRAMAEDEAEQVVPPGSSDAKASLVDCHPPGNISLLRPLTPVLAARPRYVAVLDNPSDGRILVAPFSRFSSPATPGELDLGGAGLLIRVLCLWNARWIQPGHMPAGWGVGMLTEEERRDALAVQTSLLKGMPAPPALAERTGPPLRHPLDPRCEYLEMEREWVDLCLPGERLREPESGGGAYPHTSGAAILLLAAEDKAVYRTSKNEGPKPPNDSRLKPE